MLRDISPALRYDALMTKMKSATHILSVRAAEQRNGAETATLARDFDAGLDAAQRALKAMTQRGTRPALSPALSRWLRMSDMQL